MVRLLIILMLFISVGCSAQTDSLDNYSLYIEVPNIVVTKMQGKQSSVWTNDYFNARQTNDGTWVVSYSTLESFKKDFIKRKLIDAKTWSIKVVALHYERDFPPRIIDTLKTE